MKRFKVLIAAGAVIVLLAALLTGCSTSFMSFGSDLPGHIQLQYGNFNGPEINHVVATSGQEITVNYAAEVKNGSLSLDIKDPSGVSMWTMDLEDGVKDTVTLVADQPGEYAITITGQDTKGKYDVSWKVE